MLFLRIDCQFAERDDHLFFHFDRRKEVLNMYKPIRAGSAEARLRRAIRRTIEDLGGRATAQQLQESILKHIYPRYRQAKGLKSLTRKLDTLVDEGELVSNFDDEGFPLVDVYSVVRRKEIVEEEED